MSHAVWNNISLGNGLSGPIYRVWDAVAALLPVHGTASGTWTVVQISNTGTAWASDTDPVEGSWVVIQCETPNADASKRQIFLGFRRTTGNLAGFGSKAGPALYCAYSPNGGWDASAHYFGASLAAWQNGSIKAVSGYDAACTMTALWFTSGASNRPGGFGLLTRSGSGSNAYSFAVPEIRPPDGAAESMARSGLLFGQPSSTGSGWLSTVGGGGIVCKTSVDGFSVAGLTKPTAYGTDRDTSANVDTDGIRLNDITAGLNCGLACDMYVITGTNGTSDAGVGRMVWENFDWLYDSTRDGSWV